eukprot:13951427-Alexandrium_andersonii.AAC.1
MTGDCNELAFLGQFTRVRSDVDGALAPHLQRHREALAVQDPAGLVEILPDGRRLKALGDFGDVARAVKLRQIALAAGIRAPQQNTRRIAKMPHACVARRARVIAEGVVFEGPA